MASRYHHFRRHYAQARRDQLQQAHEHIERQLKAQAEAPTPAPRSRLAWLQQHSLPPVRPIEFASNGTSLTMDAQASLALVAKASYRSECNGLLPLRV